VTDTVLVASSCDGASAAPAVPSLERARADRAPGGPVCYERAMRLARARPRTGAPRAGGRRHAPSRTGRQRTRQQSKSPVLEPARTTGLAAVQGRCAKRIRASRKLSEPPDLCSIRRSACKAFAGGTQLRDGWSPSARTEPDYDRHGAERALANAGLAFRQRPPTAERRVHGSGRLAHAQYGALPAMTWGTCPKLDNTPSARDAARARCTSTSIAWRRLLRARFCKGRAPARTPDFSFEGSR
jgi:hypothetical protein